MLPPYLNADKLEVSEFVFRNGDRSFPYFGQDILCSRDTYNRENRMCNLLSLQAHH